MYPKQQYTNILRFGIFYLLDIFVYKGELSERSWGIDYVRPPLFHPRNYSTEVHKIWYELSTKVV
jgi:hypothetical protein